jgi:hypothetical protein
VENTNRDNTVYQQAHTTTLKDCAKDFCRKKFQLTTPLVITGDVAKLHGHFNWCRVAEAGSVFRELEKYPE